MPLKPLIKICGLKNQSALDAAIMAGTDMVGFVFVEKSPRYITPDAAKELVEHVGGRALCVGLFADQSEYEIEAISNDVGLEMIQLHGSETDDTISFTRRKVAPKPLIVARGVRHADDIAEDKLPAMQPGEFLLLDAKPPEGAAIKGGHGQAFNWTVLESYQSPVPWLLAGGLTPDNVGEAINSCKHVPGFMGVDVSTGVEIARGEKDEALISAFVSAARAAMGARS